MSRHRHKEWSNNRVNGKWVGPATAKIVWYQNERGENIRLRLEDCERGQDYYPQSVEEADHVWQMFKTGAPLPNDRIPFVASLIELTKHSKFRRQHGLPLEKDDAT